jgi:hypothetical protein
MKHTVCDLSSDFWYKDEIAKDKGSQKFFTLPSQHLRLHKTLNHGLYEKSYSSYFIDI